MLCILKCHLSHLNCSHVMSSHLFKKSLIKLISCLTFKTRIHGSHHAFHCHGVAFRHCFLPSYEVPSNGTNNEGG